MEEVFNQYIIPSMMIFFTGLLGLIFKRNMLVIFMSIELMLCSAMLIMVSFASIYGDIKGASFSFFIITIAAAEVALGLAVIVQFFKMRKSISMDAADSLGD